ncbi:hypothetical protein [Arthrobacter sp.]|uniref:hypothetical protein n=1 Tax=Arthrobacter sp. TaxID=1667 RepID=UPI00289911B7|nr:hypothetical protein [Arthrobacter sp.]
MSTALLDTGYLQLQVPDGWESSIETDTAVVRAPVTGGFRPNATAHTQAFHGSVARAATQGIAGALAALDKVHVLSCTLWPVPDTDGGRWIEYTYELQGTMLHLQQGLLLRRSLLTTFTAICRTSQLPVYEDHFAHLAGSLRFAAAATEPEGGPE